MTILMITKTIDSDLRLTGHWTADIDKDLLRLRGGVGGVGGVGGRGGGGWLSPGGHLLHVPAGRGCSVRPTDKMLLATSWYNLLTLRSLRLPWSRTKWFSSIRGIYLQVGRLFWLGSLLMFCLSLRGGLRPDAEVGCRLPAYSRRAVAGSGHGVRGEIFPGQVLTCRQDIDRGGVSPHHVRGRCYRRAVESQAEGARAFLDRLYELSLELLYLAAHDRESPHGGLRDGVLIEHFFLQSSVPFQCITKRCQLWILFHTFQFGWFIEFWYFQFSLFCRKNRRKWQTPR